MLKKEKNEENGTHEHQVFEYTTTGLVETVFFTLSSRRDPKEEVMALIWIDFDMVPPLTLNQGLVLLLLVHLEE